MGMNKKIFHYVNVMSKITKFISLCGLDLHLSIQ